MLGADGSGVVASVGDEVNLFHEGDRVYGSAFLSPKSGFYAEYAVVGEEQTAAVPRGLTLTEAGVLSIDGVTALRGLRDVLDLREGEGILIFGASGGVGHLAVQLALIMGARVLAVASGGDGVKLVEGLGAHVAVDGHGPDVKQKIEEAVAAIAPNGLDSALVTAKTDALDVALDSLRSGACMAWPAGVSPEPHVPSGVTGSAYSGRPDREILDELNRMVESGPFTIHVHEEFSLDDASAAHRALNEHYLGKLALRVDAEAAEAGSTP